MSNKPPKTRKKEKSKIPRFENFKRNLFEREYDANMPEKDLNSTEEFVANITNSPIVSFFKTYDLNKLEELPNILNKLKHLIPPFKSEEMVNDYSTIRKDMFNIKKRDEKYILNKPTSELIPPFISMNQFISDTEEQLNKVGANNKEFQTRLSEKIQSINKSEPLKATSEIVKDYYSKYDAISDKELTLKNDQTDILVLLWISAYEIAVWRKAIENLPFPKSSRNNLDLSPQENSFLRGYDIQRLYAFYFIYYKLGGVVTPAKDPWNAFNEMIIRLKSFKESYNKSGEINDETFEVVSGIDGMIFLFGEHLKGLPEMKDLEQDDSEKVKLFHYSRFIRVFEKNYKATPLVITSLLHVYEYELKLWKESIEQPPKVEIPVVVAEDTEDQLNAVRTFLSRFDDLYTYTENELDIKANQKTATSGESNSSINMPIDKPKVEPIIIKSSVGEDNIRFFISILKKIATDDKFKGSNIARPNSTINSFEESDSNNLVLLLEGNLKEIKELKVKFETDKTQKTIFADLKKILEDTTGNINKVEVFLNSRKKLCKENDFISLIKEGILPEKSKTASFTAHLTMGAFLISFFGIIIIGSLTLASGGAMLGALILSVIICVSVHCALYPIEYAAFSFKDRFMYMIYGKMMTYIWEKNGWGKLNKEEVWNVTIQRIEPFFKSPYEFVWGVMLYTGKRVEWDKQMDPFFSQSTDPRKTFMDKKNEAMKKADEAFKKMANSNIKKSSRFGFTLPSLMKLNFHGPPLSSIFKEPKFRWTKKPQNSKGSNNKTMQSNPKKSVFSFTSTKNTTVKNRTVKNTTVKNTTVKNTTGSNNQPAYVIRARVEKRRAENQERKAREEKGKAEERKAIEEHMSPQDREARFKDRLARWKSLPGNYPEIKALLEKEAKTYGYSMNQNPQRNSPTRTIPKKGTFKPVSGANGFLAFLSTFGGGTRPAKTRRRTR